MSSKKENQREKRRVYAGCNSWSWVQKRWTVERRGKKIPITKWYVINPDTDAELDVGVSPVPLTAWGKKAVDKHTQQ